ncbi:hypothetical protein N8633_01430 [bacterium]|nr:hypothetical protein [bacterium]
MSEETSSVVSFSGLIVVVLCAVFGLYLLMPDDRQMTDRLMEDGKYESALEMLESMDPEQKAANLEFYQTTKFRLKRMLVDVAEQDLIQGLLKEAVASYREVGEKAEELFVELIKLLQMLTDPLGAFAIIEPAIDELPIASRTELYRHLSELALAREEPVLAAEIFSRYLLDNISDPNAVWESARLWRMAALPGDAIEAIETFSIANVTNLFVEHERLFVLKVHLFRELSQPQTAFDELNEVLAGKDQFPVESPAVKEELAEVYIKAGIESENGLLVLPFLESYLRLDECVLNVGVGNFVLNRSQIHMGQWRLPHFSDHSPNPGHLIWQGFVNNDISRRGTCLIPHEPEAPKGFSRIQWQVGDILVEILIQMHSQIGRSILCLIFLILGDISLQRMKSGFPLQAWHLGSQRRKNHRDLLECVGIIRLEINGVESR